MRASVPLCNTCIVQQAYDRSNGQQNRVGTYPGRGNGLLGTDAAAQ